MLRGLRVACHRCAIGRVLHLDRSRTTESRLYPRCDPRLLPSSRSFRRTVRWETPKRWQEGGREIRARALFGKREDSVVGERKRYMKAKLAHTSPRNSLTWCALAIAQEVPVLRSLRVFPRIDIFSFSKFPKKISDSVES